MELNDQQATAILIEGTNRKLYESGGAIPADEAARLKDATDLVSAAEAAFRNGNKSENVETIIFLSQSDTQPIISENGSSEITPAQSAPEVQSHIHNGLDLSTLTDGILDALIEGLDAYPQNEKVEEDRTAYVAEKERRANAPAQKGQEITPPAAASAAEEKAGEIAPEGAPSTDEGAGEHTAEAERPDSGAAPPDGGTGRSAGNTDEDAGAFARAQTPETSPEGKAPKAAKIDEDGNRAEIEAQLTLPMCKAHGIDLTKLPTIPTEKLKFIVDNPEGPPKMPVSESEVEANAIPSDVKGVSVGGISADVKAQEIVVTKADLGLNVDEETSSGGISAEREKMESLVTGPMLKNYRRGRKEIPSIGDNELRFMLLNPDAKVSPEELEKAKAFDQADNDVEQAVANSPDLPMIVTKEVGGEDIVDHFLSADDRQKIAQKGLEIDDDLTEVTLPSEQKVRIKLPDVEAEIAQDKPKVENLADPIKVSEEKDRTIAQAAQESVSKAQPIQAPEVISSPAPVPAETVDDDLTVDTHAEKSQQQSRAMEIISKENFPIPPNYKDEEAPVLPQDVSKVTRDELFSLHAQFHAYESRMNWILAQYEDELYDYIKLRNYREAIVANSVPFMGEDGRRNTNEFREAKVRGDQEVLELGMKEHEVEKTIKKLKVLNNGYHRDCERLSRQMSKYETERIDAPR